MTKPTKIPTKKPYVIVAEDDPNYAKLYTRVLANEDVEFKVITDGGKVIPELLKRKPDLLLLDLVMPHMHGLEILQKIRKTAPLQDLKVIVASNLSQQVDQQAASTYGISDYFIKSDISVDEMIERLKMALEG